MSSRARREPGRLFPVERPVNHRALVAGCKEGLDRYGWWWLEGIHLQGKNGVWLNGIRGTRAAGVPDLLAFCPGWFLGLECKVPPDRPKPDQLAWLEAILAAGGLAWVIRPRDDKQLLANWLARPAAAPPFHGWTPAGG